MIGASRYIDVAAVGIFLVGYLCPYVPPETFWWTGLAAIGLPFTSCLLAVLTVPLLMERPVRKSLVTVHVFVLALLVVRFVHPASWTGDPEPRGDDLVIMTQNLPSAPIERARRSSWELLSVVRRVKPHLIGIQEGIVLGLDTGNYRSTREEKFRVLMDSLDYRTGPVPPSEGRMMPAWHDPVLARIPIQDQRQIEVEYPAKPLEEPLRFVRTELVWNGRKMVHYNIHLATYGTSKPWRSIRGRAPFSPTTIVEYLGEIRAGFIRRAWEARKIRTMIERETAPVVVSGDFNCTPNNWAYRHLATGLQDTWVAVGVGWGATYYSAFPVWRIDYVLASRELDPVSADVVAIPTDVSDHRALVARVRWQGRDASL
jgi:endonuclease/exonuclease/phosphatase family metal-dependent hydrolase